MTIPAAVSIEDYRELALKELNLIPDFKSNLDQRTIARKLINIKSGSDWELLESTYGLDNVRAVILVICQNNFDNLLIALDLILDLKDNAKFLDKSFRL